MTLGFDKHLYVLPFDHREDCEKIVSAAHRGVPFYIRAGKSLPVTFTEVLVRLRHPPTMHQGSDPAPNLGLA
jgi:hypothetical protein